MKTDVERFILTPKIVNELYDLAVKKWCERPQVLMAVEEMGELLQAISKYDRGKIGAIDVAEEIADVKIMLEQLERMLHLENYVQSERENKLWRLGQMLGKFPQCKET